MVKLAVFGGAFDPPHLGHAALIERALEQFDFDRLLVVPAGDPPHKLVKTPAEIRLRLAELAFGELPQVEISRLEIEPGGPRYTVDTLRLLAGQADDLTLLVGADQLVSFLSWREPAAILELAQLAVATRPGYSEEDLQEKLAALPLPGRATLFSIPAHDISSEAIRARVRAGFSVASLVSPAVASEIKRLGLYRP